MQATAKNEGLLENLKLTLIGVSILGELSPRSRDLILSFGERMAAPIVAAALEARGVKSESLTGGEAGIVTDDSYGEASPMTALTRKKVLRTLAPLISEAAVPVITGFIANTKTGDVTTSGEGDRTTRQQSSQMQLEQMKCGYGPMSTES